MNALVFDPRPGGRLFSADGAGVLVIWRRIGDGSRPSDFRVVRSLKHPDFRGRSVHLFLRIKLRLDRRTLKLFHAFVLTRASHYIIVYASNAPPRSTPNRRRRRYAAAVGLDNLRHGQWRQLLWWRWGRSDTRA